MVLSEARRRRRKPSNVDGEVVLNPELRKPPANERTSNIVEDLRLAIQVIADDPRAILDRI